MIRAFADTSFYQALLNPRDGWHQAALRLSGRYRGTVYTSEYVLCELGSLMARGQLRSLFLEFVRELNASINVEVIHASHECFEAGLRLFADRPDKDWSLVDCTSFVIMNESGINQALATDHHFQQAGFNVLLTQ